jgi:hypothetical protein
MQIILMRLKLVTLPFLLLNASPALAQSNPSTEALIQALETGLGSPVEVTGRPTVHQTLLATMQHHQCRRQRRRDSRR